MAAMEKARKEKGETVAETPVPPANPEAPMFTLLRQIKEALIDLKKAVEAKENGMTHQLCRIADAMEAKNGKDKAPAPTPAPVAKAPTPAVAPQAAPAPQAQAAGTKLQEIQGLFTQDLQAMLLFEAKKDKDGTFIFIKPRQYLGSDNFAKIASVVRDNGGAYVSAGKDSHFRVYYI